MASARKNLQLAIGNALLKGESFLVDGVCYSVPPLGIPGIFTPAVPALCDLGVGTFESGRCWTIPPIDGIPGTVNPAVPKTCNFDPDGFDRNDACWTVEPTDGVPGIKTDAVEAACNFDPDGFEAAIKEHIASLAA